MENTKNQQFDEEIRQTIELISGKKLNEIDDKNLYQMIISMRMKFNLAYTKGKIDCHKDYHNDAIQNKNIKMDKIKEKRTKAVTYTFYGVLSLLGAILAIALIKTAITLYSN